MSVRISVRMSHLHYFPIPAVLSQNVNIESYLTCVKREKYGFWVTLRHLGSMRQGEVKLHMFQYQAR